MKFMKMLLVISLFILIEIIFCGCCSLQHEQTITYGEGKALPLVIIRNQKL